MQQSKSKQTTKPIYNFLSYILYIHHLNHDCKNINILTDFHETVLAKNIIQNLNLLDICLLKKIAQKHQIVPLKYLENYIFENPCTLIFNDRQILLGRSTRKNLLEILRKFPILFFNSSKLTDQDLAQIETSFYQHIDHLAEQILSSSAMVLATSTTTPTTNNKYFDILKNLQDITLKIQTTKTLTSSDLSLKTFLDLLQLQATHQKKNILDNFSLLEVFIYLLSPHYYLKIDELNADLHSMFIRRGGTFFSSASSANANASIQVEKKLISYSYMCWEQNDNEYSPLFNSSTISNNLIISNTDAILSDIPYIEIKHTRSKNILKTNFLVPYIKGNEFNQSYYHNKVLNDNIFKFKVSPMSSSSKIEHFQNVSGANLTYQKYFEHSSSISSTPSAISKKNIMREYGLISSLLRIDHQLHCINQPTPACLMK
ncbi:MAG: hypothetical protein HQK49_00665 [Oligoflexia bacterium]|nr:hypothetical protein [Oligoflexia bacterium]